MYEFWEVISSYPAACVFGVGSAWGFYCGYRFASEKAQMDKKEADCASKALQILP